MMTATPVKLDPQSIGSCVTYLRRYSLAAIVGVSPEDDDGNAATGKKEEARVAPLPRVTDREKGKIALENIKAYFGKYFAKYPQPEETVARIKMILAEKVFHTASETEISKRQFGELEQGAKKIFEILTNDKNNPTAIVTGNITYSRTDDIPNEVA
jgi:hypothetical protein